MRKGMIMPLSMRAHLSKVLKGRKGVMGVYKRTPAQLRMLRKSIAYAQKFAYTKEAQRKRIRIMKERYYSDDAYRRKLGDAIANSPIIQSLEFRKRVSLRSKVWIAKHGSNLRGGSGREPTGAESAACRVLFPFGFVAEFSIKTKGVIVSYIPRSYRVDFANPNVKLAIELDGWSHRPRKIRFLDAKKDRVLSLLGWKVLRLRHKYTDKLTNLEIRTIRGWASGSRKPKQLEGK